MYRNLNLLHFIALPPFHTCAQLETSKKGFHW